MRRVPRITCRDGVCGLWGLSRWWGRGLHLRLASSAAENVGKGCRIDQAEEKKRLERGVCELGCLLEEGESLTRIVRNKILHLRDEVEELRCRRLAEGFRYSIRDGEAC